MRYPAARKALATNVDDHLGWLALDGAFFSVMERSPFKESFPLDELDSDTRLTKLSEQWGAILASAHARADVDYDARYVDRSFEDAVIERVAGDTDGFVQHTQRSWKRQTSPARTTNWSKASSRSAWVSCV